MRCQKCGFIGFDYLNKCKKCGADLTAVREGFGFMPAKPSAPSFLGALTGGMQAQTSEAAPSPEEEGVSLPGLDFGEDLVFSPDEPMEPARPAMAAAGAPAPELAEPLILSDEDLTIELEDEEAEKDLELDLDLSLDEDPAAAEAPEAPIALDLDLDAAVSMDEVPSIEPEDLEVELDLSVLDAELPPPGADVQAPDTGQLEIDFDYSPDLDAQPQAIPKKPSPDAEPSLLSTVDLDLEEDGSMEFVLEPVDQHLIDPVRDLSAEEEFDLGAVDKELGITLEEEQPGAGPDAGLAAPSGEESEAEAPQSLKITSDDSEGLVIEISEDDLEDLMVNLGEGKLNRDHRPGDGGANGR
ncbi:MAG: hypothetical protein LLF99_18230 [Desulfobacteraceae bacterium]|nr:hypothetical protein [Desulfobacteraceae bacterium]